MGLGFSGGGGAGVSGGALAYKSADATAFNGSGGVLVGFNSTRAGSTSGVHNDVTNSERLTVPAGWTEVELIAQIGLTQVSGGSSCALIVEHYNSAGVQQVTPGLPMAEGTANAAYIEWIGNAKSPPLPVTAGDYFALRFYCNDTSVTIQAARSFFSIRRTA